MKSLLKIRFLQMINIIKEAGKTGIRKYFLFLLLGAGILGVMFYFFNKVFGFLANEEQIPQFFKLFISEKILMMAFLTMFMMLILSALISALSIYYMSRDLPLLLSSPLSAGTVFYWKTIEVTVSSSLMVIFFAFPVLGSYARYFIPGEGHLSEITLMFLLYILSGVFIGIIVGIMVPLFFSVKRMQPVLSLVSIVLMCGIVVFLRLLRPERFSNPDTILNAVSFMKTLKIGFMEYLPFAWLSRGLNALAEGEDLQFWKFMGLFFLLVCVLALCIHFLQKAFYLMLIDKIGKGSSSGIRSTWRQSFFSKGKYGPLWHKEIKTFLRSPAQWSQLLIIGAIMIVFILNIRGIPGAQSSFKPIVSYLNLGMAAFIVAGLNSRFAFTTIPLEYPGIVHVFASPYRKDHIYSFKVLFYLIPQVFLGYLLFFAGDLSLHLDMFARISGILFLLPVLPVLTIMAIYFSLRIEDQVPLTPQHLVTSRNGISYMLWSLVYVVVSMVVIIKPMYLYYRSQFMRVEPPMQDISLWFGGFILVNLGIMILLIMRSRVLWRRRQFH